MASGGDEVESLSERQENELQILNAIYMDDVKDLRENDPWKVHRPPEVKITLGPQESVSTNEAHVHVDLVVKCPTLYPEAVPSLKLINPKGLANQQLDVLKEELDEMARKLVGEVMILDLCQHVQKYLHSHNKAPAKSFYDEMITNKRLQEEKYAREHKQKQELFRQREAQKIEDEIEKRQEALREEARKRRELTRLNTDARYSSSSDPSTPSTDALSSMTPIPKDTQQRLRIQDSPSKRTPITQVTVAESGSYHKPERRRRTSTPLSGDSDCHECGDGSQKSGVTILTFNTKKERKVYMGKCLGHSARGSTVYAGMDTKSGDLVTVSEWMLKWRHINRKLNLDERERDEQEANKYMKQVAAIEKEMFSLLRLNHKHLVHYQAFKYVLECGKITLYILMDYVGGGNLSSYIKRKEAPQLDLMRHYTTQTLQALDYIHSKAVIHRDIRASSMMLDQSGKVCLGDVSLSKRLTDLVAEVNGTPYDDKAAPVIGGRSGKKGDIYRLGLVLLSLAKGEVVTETLPQISTSLPQEFCDLLKKCLMKDEMYRWSAQQLSEHSFVKTPLYTQPLCTSNKQKLTLNGHRDSESDDDASEEHVIPFIPASDSGSRLQNEFEILKWLGKGGFGDVIKVKNKLDGRFYAIKRIPLNPSKKAFTRKITREVKLLSMLNHENVVRYYNSWIETSSEPISHDTSSSYTSQSPAKFSQSPINHHNFKKDLKHLQTLIDKKNTKPEISDVFLNSLNVTDNLGRAIKMPDIVDASIEWSVSVDFAQKSEEEDSSEDEDDVFGATFLPHSDSEDDGIVFEHNSNTNSNDNSDSEIMQMEPVVPTKQTSEDETDGIIIPRIQFLYIQMEFCEKSTLRHCIDAGIYEDVDRVWQLFREIVEGLVHIHKQGMIHRDLKPVNIFLDSNDHVKIGDFGLATTDIIAKQQTTLKDLTMNPSLVRDLNCSSSHSESLEGMEDMTGKVGTALYVAPEMSTTCKRVHYSQKVDIYSLGVMFFEMCYHPLPTGMERVKILNNLREPGIHFPDDFDVEKLSNQAHLLKLLLTHDPSKRPTASEILQSEYVPPPQMEEAELNEVLRSTIANPDSRLYKRMIGAIFSQPITPAMDFAYDNELYKISNPFNVTLAQTTSHVADTIDRIFCKHGAVRLSTPMLMPKSSLYENNESYVCFMDHIGGLVALPYDLKAPFARFIARHGTNDLKRYSIEKVFRENRVYGLHPKELVACSFDIVTPTTASFLPDAEVIAVVFEIITEFPVLQGRSYFLRINHKMLLEGIFLYCGIPYDRHQEVYAILGDTKNEKQRKTQIQTRLCSLSLSEHSVDTLYNFVETEGPYNRVASMLRRITKTKGLASSLASKGLKEMEAIISHTEAFGVKVQVVLTLGLISNVQHFSGAIFQVVRTVHKKTRQTTEVLAAGGRYDNLLAQFRKPGTDPSQCVVGISIAMERVVAAAAENKGNQLPATHDVLVCSLGAQAYIKDKLTVTKELWAAGISATISYDTTQTLEDIQEQCRRCGVSHVVILKDSESHGGIRVRSLEKDKFQEKKMKLNELTSYIQQKIQNSTQEMLDPAQSQTSKSSSSNQQLSEGNVAKDTAGSSLCQRHNINITIINLDHNVKGSKNTRRNYESQVYTNISSCLSNISSKSSIEIVVVELTSQVIKTIAAYLDLDEDEKAFSNSIGPIVERHTRHRKYLTKIFDHISEIRFEKGIPVIILYGSKDDSYKVLL